MCPKRFASVAPTWVDPLPACACGGADFSAIGIGLFPKVLQYQSAQKLASTSARSEQSVAGWPYPQADEAFAAAGAYNKRLAESGQAGDWRG